MSIDGLDLSIGIASALPRYLHVYHHRLNFSRHSRVNTSPICSVSMINQNLSRCRFPKSHFIVRHSTWGSFVTESLQWVFTREDSSNSQLGVLISGFCRGPSICDPSLPVMCLYSGQEAGSDKPCKAIKDQQGGVVGVPPEATQASWRGTKVQGAYA